MEYLFCFILGIQTMCLIGYLFLGFKLIELIKPMIDILKTELKTFKDL